MNINVSIERLVLDGLPLDRHQGTVVQAAVETELARLFAEQGLSRLSGGAVPHLSANSIRITHHSKPAQLGHQIAQSIYSSLTPTPAETQETHFPGGPSR
jgi:hypothetical protein